MVSELQSLMLYLDVCAVHLLIMAAFLLISFFSLWVLNRFFHFDSLVHLLILVYVEDNIRYLRL